MQGQETNSQAEHREMLIEASDLTKKYLLASAGSGSPDSHFALKNVSFRLAQNSSIGIIGRNGSGKSTLLKILAGIIKPTSGKAVIRGRVNGLMDIGSNFIPDLTGRQNTLMSLKLNGMRQPEFEDLLREVETFSGLEEYFDQPVKNYSSGMFVRLALAVNFQIKADILLIDEVINTGDVEFRTKALERFKTLRNSGMGMLMASHNLEEVLDNCSECIWLDKGELKMFGPVNDVVKAYYKLMAKEYSEDNYFSLKKTDDDQAAPSLRESDAQTLKNDVVEVLDFSVNPAEGKEEITYSNGFSITVKAKKIAKGCSLHPSIIIHDIFMRPIMIFLVPTGNELFKTLHEINDQYATFTINCMVPGHLLSFGTFYAELRFGKNFREDVIYTEEAFVLPHKIKFEVLQEASFNFVGGAHALFIKPQSEWQFKIEAAGQ